MSITLSMTEEHDAQLREQLFAVPSVEGAAYVLMRINAVGMDPWDRRSRLRLLVREIVPIAAEHKVSADGMHVRWHTAGFVALLQRCAAEDLVLGIAHSHPGGPARFSNQDDANEAELIRTACHRNGRETRLVSLLFDADGGIHGRLWQYDRHQAPIATINVLGDRFAFHQAGAASPISPVFARQVLAFGPALTTQLAGLRVGIVGAGGTGSATAVLAARAGVGQLGFFDDDIVEVTNLNRLHGATQSDADAMRPKAEVVAGEIARLGLGTRVVPFRGWVSDPQARDALKACDVIFCCTDDHAGRLFLSSLAYFYLIPVIDMGLAMAVAKPPATGMADISARVTVIMPPEPCLLCRGTIDVEVAGEESLRRQNPAEYDRRKREAYVRGEGNPNPAVVTFTTETACMAVNELLNRIANFRKKPMGSEIRRRFLFSEDRATSAARRPSCPVCGSPACWGMGDVEPFCVG